LIPLVILATFATIIASQAAISADAHGQIYVPAINWAMMIAVIGLVVIFQTSQNLAAAYGIAVNATMTITTILMFTIVHKLWNWSLLKSLLFLIGFLTIDLTFLASNAMKIPDGGWLPLLIALLLFTLMTTWRRGSTLLKDQFNNKSATISSFIGKITADKVLRVPGAGVFLTGRLIYTKLGSGFYQIVLHYGFIQGVNIPSDLSSIKEQDLTLDTSKVHYIIKQIEIIPGRKLKGMATWRDYLFGYMVRNTQDITATYQLPDKQTMIIGLKAGI